MCGSGLPKNWFSTILVASAQAACICSMRTDNQPAAATNVMSASFETALDRPGPELALEMVCWRQ